MLRNSKNSNSSRSFQIRTSKNNRVITRSIRVILKPERSFYDDLFKRYRLHRLTNQRTPGHYANFVFFGFFRPQIRQKPEVENVPDYQSSPYHNMMGN